jgi:hypothetical protein
MLGKTLDRLFTVEDQERGLLRNEMAAAAAEGHGGGEEGWRLRKDGSRFWAVGEVAPIREASGVVGFVAGPADDRPRWPVRHGVGAARRRSAETPFAAAYRDFATARRGWRSRFVAARAHGINCSIAK